MTRTGDREIRSVSGRLPDNPGELVRMLVSGSKCSFTSFTYKYYNFYYPTFCPLNTFFDDLLRVHNTIKRGDTVFVQEKIAIP